MSDGVRFFLPGPVWVADEVRRAMTAAPIGHRSAGFRPVYDEVATALQTVFRTSREVVTATGSATLGMEIALVSTVERRCLHLVNGAFSDRFHGIALAHGLEAERIDSPWGSAVDPDAVRRAVRGGRFEAVTVVHNETSTGALSPLSEIAAVVRAESDALLLVDAVSSLGGVPVESDAWGLDVVVTASQKALALPAGLAFLTASERAERRAEKVTRRGFYTDLLRYLRYHRDGGTITTPAAAQLYAAQVGLRRLLDEGLEARFERHRTLRRRVVSWLATSGCADAVSPEGSSPTVSCLRPPPGVGPREVVAAAAAAGMTIASGYAKLKDSTFRIGHMGEVHLADLDRLLDVLDAVLGGAPAPPAAAATAFR